MYSFKSRKSITINKEQECVLEYLLNLKDWYKWFPWLTVEPDMLIENHDELGDIAKSILWQGSYGNSGNLTLMSVDQNNIDIELHVLGPIPFSSTIKLEILSDGNHCILTWMQTINIKWKQLLDLQHIKRVLIIDITRGMDCLRLAIENPEITDKVKIMGREAFKPTQYIGIHSRVKNDDIFKQLITLYSDLKRKNNISTGKWFTLFESFDSENNEFECVVGIPISQSIKISPPYLIDTLSFKHILKIQHFGDTRLSKNAWAKSNLVSQSYGYKVVSNTIGMQFFSDPETQPLKSTILVPVE